MSAILLVLCIAFSGLHLPLVLSLPAWFDFLLLFIALWAALTFCYLSSVRLGWKVAKKLFYTLCFAFNLVIVIIASILSVLALSFKMDTLSKYTSTIALGAATGIYIWFIPISNIFIKIPKDSDGSKILSLRWFMAAGILIIWLCIFLFIKINLSYDLRHSTETDENKKEQRDRVFKALAIFCAVVFLIISVLLELFVYTTNSDVKELIDSLLWSNTAISVIISLYEKVHT